MIKIKDRFAHRLGTLSLMPLNLISKFAQMKTLLNKIEALTKEYQKLGIEQALDWKKYNHYAIVHHSTSIEGSTLTREETDLLLDQDIVAKGKPMQHHLMQKDHYNALLYILAQAKKKTPFTIEFLQNISAQLMKNTGSLHNTVLGSFDVSQGEFRLLNVTAGQTRFPDFSKVPHLAQKFCDKYNEQLKNIATSNEALVCSFDAHFDLVSIHPFADGNGRTSRLIMNYIQHQFDQVLTIVHKEDKAEYYKALVETRKQNDKTIFRAFMCQQHIKHLEEEIQKVKQADKSIEL